MSATQKSARISVYHMSYNLIKGLNTQERVQFFKGMKEFMDAFNGGKGAAYMHSKGYRDGEYPIPQESAGFEAFIIAGLFGNLFRDVIANNDGGMVKECIDSGMSANMLPGVDTVPLNFALATNAPDAFKMLLQSGADIERTKQYVAKSGDTEIRQRFKEFTGIDVEQSGIAHQMHRDSGEAGGLGAVLRSLGHKLRLS